jgi:glyoxylase-like metal-dependent hydrolase (beta-lactamase superfamily II)
MGVKIHYIVTGELENSLSNALLNSGIHPDHHHEDVLPFGFRDDFELTGGVIGSGGMVPVPVWLIEGADKVILIDTGLGDVNEVMDAQSKYGKSGLASKSADQDLVAGLAAHGVAPEDVDIVVLTHLHFDHIGNNHLFPNARFLVQRDELPQAIVPPDYCMFYYPEFAYKITEIRDQLELLDGDVQIDPAVRLLKVGGHTPGCMSVLVDTSIGTVCLASDVMYNYKNLELNWPIGSFWNLPELMSGYDRLRRESDVIVPAHDWKLRELYPSGTIG